MQFPSTRRLFVSTVIALTFSAAHAQWPERPVKIIVASAPGGSPDIVSRLIGAELAKRLGQAVVIDNRPGAAGAIGMGALANAPADGYTIGYGNNATLATNEFLYAKLPYDAKKLEPIINTSKTASLFVVNNDLPVRSIPEFIAYAKQHPNKLSFATGDAGGSGHIGAELFNRTTGIQVVHVPYKSASQAMTDLMGGQVDFLIDNYSVAGPHVNAGKMRALAVTARERTSLFPDVPTMEEAGLPGYDITAWGGFVAPAGTPSEAITRLNQELNAIIQEKDFRERMLKIGSTVVGGSPEDFRRLIEKERVKWGELVRMTGAKGN
ncbi:MAG TPA: tripartite tricarboxylate transporter substrate binding protein [Pseudorhodoferax sp.]|nr:tripartite tricarboxylate transporter substrate binding protein [Pseudorhodoferax sp.]